MKEELQGLLKQYKWKREMETYAIACGYTPIEAPLFQEYQSFLNENPQLDKEQLVLLMNDNQKLYLLRPDITSGIMKEIIPHYEEGETLKLCYQSTTYRTKSYGIKEISQFGVEYLGSHHPESEREILGMATDLLKGVPFIIEVGHSEFLGGLIQELKLKPEQVKRIKRCIQQKNREELLQLGKEWRVGENVLQLFSVLFQLQGRMNEIMDRLRGCYLNEQMRRALSNLQALEGVSTSIVCDLSMMNDFDYYQGVIFKGYYQGVHKEVLSGGRYEVPLERYGKEIKAIGFSIDMNAWMRVREREYVWNG